MKLRIVVWAIVCAASVHSIVAQAPASTVEQWDTYELGFSSPTGHRNPFVDVSLKVTFVHAAGLTLTVDGFYDGQADLEGPFHAFAAGALDLQNELQRLNA